MKDGIVMETKYSLIPYGILTEKSDIRAHVSNKVVYVFKTQNCIELIKTNKDLPYRLASQSGCDFATAKGYLIKPEMINDIRVLKFHSWGRWGEFLDSWTTTQKGLWAVDCIVELIRMARFPFWIEAKQTNDVKLDISGTDILLFMNQRIQVKCDYPASKTGNLYIQTHELNPLKRY